MATSAAQPVISQPVEPGRYRHYKGDEVEVLGTCFHSETLEEYVVYRHTTGERASERHYWVRPKQMFLEHIEVEGRRVPRFEFLD